MPYKDPEVKRARQRDRMRHRRAEIISRIAAGLATEEERGWLENLRAKTRKWREQNREALNTNRRKQYAETPEKERARKRRLRADNPEKTRDYYTKWRADNVETVRSCNRKWYANNQEKERERNRLQYAMNIEKERARRRRRYELDAESMRASTRKWQKNNAAKARETQIRRKFRKEQRTPAWADIDGMNTFYINRPDGMHVDHIVPLVGRTVEGYRVSGLHVLHNLQYLSAEDNLRKNNKMRPEDAITAPID